MIIPICFYDNLYAQDISIHFTFSDEFGTHGDKLSPYLQIEYTNKSNRNYYFPALVPLNSTFPPYSTSILICNTEEHHGRNFSHNYSKRCHYVLHEEKLFQGMRYYLPLSFIQQKYTSWELLKESVFMNEEEHEEDILNYYLYTYAYCIHPMNCEKGTFFLNQSSARNKKQLASSSSFVFIQKHGHITQQISLYGITGTGIMLTVYLPSCFSPEKIITDTGEEYYLPDKVYKYSLYRGYIESNVISKEF